MQNYVVYHQDDPDATWSELVPDNIWYIAEVEERKQADQLVALLNAFALTDGVHKSVRRDIYDILTTGVPHAVS